MDDIEQTSDPKPKTSAKPVSATPVSEEVPMPNPNMETCVFAIKRLRKDAERLLKRFDEIVNVAFSATDLAIYEEKFKTVKLQCNDWKQKFVVAVAALKEYDAFYDEHIVEFEAVEDIMDSATKLMFSAKDALDTTARETRPNFKLERVKLPTFDGSFSEWEAFRDLFSSAVDTNPTLTNAEKMVYLRTSLTGNALAIIQNFSTTNNAYSDAWDLVKRRYANPREIAFAHLRKLYELKRANDSSGDLRAVVDLVNELMRSLKSQDIPVQHWDVIIVFWIFKKLDDETRREWLLTQDTSLPTLDKFLKFLEKRACALDDTNSRAKKPTNVNQNSETKKPNPPRSTQPGKVFLANQANPAPNGTCVCCSEVFHPLNCCQKFSSLSVSDRSALIKTARLCFNCFSSKHSAAECTSKFSCQKCEKRHHTLLHQERPRPTSAPPGRSTQFVNSNVTQPNCSFGTSNVRPVLLATMQVNVLDLKGQTHPARVFVDNGSEVEFVSVDLIHRLGLKPQGKPISVTGISGVPGPTTLGKVQLTLTSRLNTFALPIEAEVVPQLTNGNMPQVKCQPSLPHLVGLDLADPGFADPQPVDILLGNRFATKIKNGGLIHGPAGMPSAENTPFGWILTGEYPLPSNPKVPTRTHHCSATIILEESHPGEGTGVGSPTSGECGLVSARSSPPTQCPGSDEPCPTNSKLEQIVQKFWESEQPDCPTIPRSKEDAACEKQFLATTTRDPTGRFVVELPFRENHPPLGSSLANAIRRFESVERRIHQNPIVRDAYIEYFRTNLTSGVMEVIPPQEIRISPRDSYYMPYSHVTKDTSTSTKLRIVFDCSAKTVKGPSLNDTLCQGPKLQVDLIPLLVKFRIFPFVISADITKFFTQIWVAHAQRDFQRLLYRESPDQPMQHLRFRRLVFGASPSPYLAIRVLHKLFDEACDDPTITDIVKSDVLVDNVLTGAFTIERAAHVQNVLRSIMAQGHFPLCKWVSNVPTLLSNVPPEEREVTAPLTIRDPDGLPTLGLRWNPTSDTMTVVIPPMVDPPKITKRSILSYVAKLYDPLGWLSPVSIRAKILLQEIWKLKVNWDDPVPPEIVKQWNAYSSDLPHLANFAAPRCYFPPTESSSEHAQYQLFGFCDASNHAHAAVVYIRRVTPTDVCVTLIGSKTKVTPVKGETTPRSELDGAKLLASFMKTVISALPVPIQSVQCYTDSTSVLGWLSATSNPLRRREIFVLNRVRTISELLPHAQWNHVSGIENPADLPSRGISAKEFLSSAIWTHGPPWLRTIHAPPCVSTYQVMATEPSPLLDYICSTSSLPKMQNFVAAGRRFLRNVKSGTNDNTPLTPSELEDALLIIVKVVQEQTFPEELRLLNRGAPPSSEKVKFLAPFVDAQGLLRVGGRLSQGQFPYNKKHPMLLPKNHHFTEVLIRHLHLKHLHAGPTLLLCILRDKFWIFDGPTTVKKIVRKCVRCFRHNPIPLRQLMAPLPEHRLNPCLRPFINTAMDFAGPFILATVPGRKPRLEKHYFCVFVCTATKAVHLELVGDLSTPAFVAALTRFVSRRGLPRVIVCDGGTNFVGAKNELDDLQKIIESPTFQSEIKVYATECGIEFLINPPLAPHHGGLFEAAVKSAKFHLRRIVGDQHLSIEEFQTLLTQVEAALNSRPLLPLTSDPSDFQVLTPAHFLIGDALHAVPAYNYADVELNRLTRWELVQQFSQHFWKRFTAEYVGTLQSRPKWIQPQPNIEPGVLVLVQESDASFSSHHWNLARITAVYPGPDGKVRVVDVKTPKGNVYRRPITRIAPLPIEHRPISEEEPIVTRNPSSST